MNVSNRQRQILELLLNRKEEITAAEIAAEIKVSTRTVHREMLDLEPVLAFYGVVLQKKSGSGIQIQASQEQLEQLRSRLLQIRFVEYSTDERKILILCLLLEADEPVKLFSLAYDLHVTVPTVSHDLDELEQWINKYGLTLIRRRGYGVLIHGSEEDKRNMISQLALEHLETSDLYGKPEQQVHPVTGRLLAMLGKQNWTGAEEALWRLEEQWPVELSEADYTDLLIRLTVTIARIQQGKRVGTVRDIHDGQTAVRVGKATDHMIKHLSEILKLRVPEEEAAYIAGLLRWEQRTLTDRLLPQDDLSLVETVQRLIRYMEEASGEPFGEDRSLREGLIHHLEPALQRIKEGVQIRNPLLSQIQKDYAALFRLVRQGIDRTVTRLTVPDEEIGFLVMHFGASLERLKQFSRNVKALVVCTNGIGSSKLLTIRLEKEMPQIEIIGQVSWYEAARISGEAYDLIISTVDLPLDPDQYIKISPLLTKKETEQLRRFIQDITLKRSPMDLANSGTDHEALSLERLRTLKMYLDESVALLDRFKVYRLDNLTSGSDVRGVLTQACEAVRDDGALEQTGPIVEQLLVRESYGSLVIPDTQLALFHTRSKYSHKPLFSLFRLSEGLILHAEQPSEVRQLLLMLGPQELSKESLEVLSEISALLLLPDMIRLLESGTTQDIKQFIAAELAAFLENKMETGRTT